MKKKLFLFLLIITIFNHAFSDNTIFKNLIDLKYTPVNYSDKKIAVFFDHGSWFGFGLSSRQNSKSGFTGPFLSTSTKYISPSFARIFLKFNKKKLITNKAFVVLENSLNPGYLYQKLKYKNITIEQKLIFKDSKSAIIKVKFKNTGTNHQTFKFGWQGDFFYNPSLKLKDNQITLMPENSPIPFYISFPENITIHITKGGYQTSGCKIVLPAAAEYSTSYSAQYSSKFSSDKIEFDNVFKTGQKRWQNMIKSVLKQLKPEFNSSKFQKLAVKSLFTMILNWKGPMGDLRHDGLFPSAFVSYFNGFWAWDSWKHAVALTIFHPQLAKDQILAMFDYQNKSGMIADCIYYQKKENNWRDTKPPLAGWAIWKIYQKTSDKKFLKSIYPKLLSYHNWWYQDRDQDKDGLCEYGSTDGTRIAAAWESGMDNAVRFDQAQLVKSDNSAFSFNQESVDLNSFLYLEKLYLAKMALVLKEKATALKMKNDADNLKKKILKTMFNPRKNFFFDISITHHKYIEVEGPEGFVPLWAGIPSPEQAEGIKNVMIDKKMFNTFVPFPTLNCSHPSFNPLKGYWRGPVWLDSVYFAVKGLQNFGFVKEANYFINKVIHNGEGILEDGFPIHENYHPITGKALNAPNFSWSAAHILLMLTKD